MCIALCGPAIATAGPPTAAALGSPITQALIAGLAGGGIGMVVAPSGSSGGGLPPDLSNRLSDIYSTYPKTGGECACAATETLKAFQGAGIDGDIYQVFDGGRSSGRGLLLDSDGNPLSNTNYHEVVVVDGRFYDALTGAEGADSWDEYLKLWHQDHKDYMRAIPK